MSLKKNNMKGHRSCWTCPDDKGRLHLLFACWFNFIVLLSGPLHGAYAAEPFTLSEQTLRWAAHQYGSAGRDRLLEWQDFMQTVRTEAPDEATKLEKVNNFINKFLFISDSAHWGTEDYWATPTEFIASGGGDCEDFAIAKYFCLVTLGISDEKLALHYYTVIDLRQQHLALAYYPSPQKEPLLLDNLVAAIEPVSRRTNVEPLYCFNAKNMWEAKQNGLGKNLGDSRRIRPWRELLARIDQHLITSY